MLHLAVVAATLVPATQPEASAHARLTPVPMTSVTLSDGFWAERLETNRRSTLPAAFHQCEITGRLANFERAAGMAEGGHEGYFFNDSDVYKIIEGASSSLALHPDPELDGYLDDLIATIAAAQQPDGYLNTYYTLEEPDARWSNVQVRHELYCAGHLFEAAVAHYEATGKRSLLDVALRFADNIDETFGPDGRRSPPGHEEIEIGLVKLYRTTGERRYLELAEFFLEQRGRPEGHALYGEYAQDHAPVAAQAEAVGHAVRAAYLYAGMAEVVAETGDQAYKRALDVLWDDVVGTKLYVTGAIGASRAGEAFGPAYELPNDSAYAETCAAIAAALWAQRMLLIEPDTRYADIVERAMYNGFLVGISLEGDRFFYPNPLATDGLTPFNHGSAERAEWFACACCPSNDVRFVPRVLSYLYATDREGNLYANQFAAGAAQVSLGGVAATITQRTEYPWAGRIELRVDPEEAVEASVFLRIPGWARNRPVPSDLYSYVGEVPAAAVVTVNGKVVPLELSRGYARVSREWKRGDRVVLDLPMEPRRVLSNPSVEANVNRVAVERGPIVYCAEGADNDGRVLNLALPDGAPLAARKRSGLLGGVVAIEAEGVRRRVDLETMSVVDEPASITLVPYYAWNNRGANEMAIWLPRDPSLIPVPPQPTVASLARVRVSHVWSADSPAAINDLREPASSSDQTIPRHTWWPRRGTTEWAELHLAEPTEVSGVSLYWFDDTGAGQCRAPGSYRVLYEDGGEWREVSGASGLGVERDAFNTTTFEPVTTTGLRVEVELREGFSSGILEWKVNE